jgi:hypothetical protein
MSWLESGNASSRTPIGLGEYRTVGRGDGCISRTLTRERYGNSSSAGKTRTRERHDCRRISDSIDRAEACHASSGCLHALHREGEFGRRRRLTVADLNRGRATTCRRTGCWASASRSRSKSVFQSRPRVHQMSQNLCGRRQLDNSTPLKHAPLTFPAHCLGYPRSSMCSGDGEDHPAPARRPEGPLMDTTRPWHRFIAPREAGGRASWPRSGRPSGRAPRRTMPIARRWSRATP